MIDEKYAVYKIDGSFMAALLVMAVNILGVLVLTGMGIIPPGAGTGAVVVLALIKGAIESLNREDYKINELDLP
ncbi:hypothetical protein ACFQL7_20690 [Halocatena marina]|uniref:Uncharacterized protein n=1 Tax=Halocatena marina TaxID=2934937 RepID=A0ABD5YUN2_9EURY|nr:hypothetical protein [Halocatena marina]